MRKVIAVIIAVLILSFPGMALAQMEKGEGMMDDKGMEMKEHGMMHDGMMGQGDMMGGPMMKHMMGPIVVATSDGGVVVVIGDKMTKYDQDLDVIGQADLKADMQGMKKKCGCGMMGKGMEKMADEPKAATVTEPATEVKPEAAAATEPAKAEPAAIAEPAAEPKAAAEPAAEAKPEAAAEPKAAVEPAAEVKPATTEPAAVTNTTVPSEEGNHTDQK